ncbi:hypothetical protein CPLU01_10441 [Colletotrichum plurivorum]|uniref:Uncharacterized protein n=1 Tax=Colletotrichum plurivorum TaxID=2175906 RepID=A0A8H6NA12_9PEZI|nr:hypothetical protein CPLU01_10441 [Colletotrichum plurivorum]
MSPSPPVEMADCLRPTDDAFKNFYERAYRTWFTLLKRAAANRSIPPTCLRVDPSLFSQHPALPVGVGIDQYGLVKASSTWTFVGGACDTPEFHQTFQVFPSVHKPTKTVIFDDRDLELPIGEDDEHLIVLVHAWAYVLSARWTKIVASASPMEYTASHASWAADQRPHKATDGSRLVTVELGSNLTDDAARWWTAVLAPGVGWKAAIPGEQYRGLSPWSVTHEDSKYAIILNGPRNLAGTCGSTTAPFEAALQYINDYCALHRAHEKSRAALAAALQLPLANLERRTILLHAPRACPVRRADETAPAVLDSQNDGLVHQMDILLTLSINVQGMRSLLGSVFYEPGIPANACGAWLQGTMAVLKSKEADSLPVLARMFCDRRPHISYLWLGGIVTGAHKDFLRSNLHLIGLKRIDLHAATWTGTLHSFIQEPTTPVQPGSKCISRADKCRLIFLTQEPPRDIPPIFPYPPLGETAIQDADLDVQLHAHCPHQHRLRFVPITWNCADGTTNVQEAGQLPQVHRSVDTDGCQGGESEPIEVDYGWLDRERDTSESVTRNLFTWMRDMDGFTVAEREILQHEWIDAFDSSDDESVGAEGDGASGYGLNNEGKMGRWLARAMTARRRNSA